MEKKIYEKPVAQEERFVPNHYASLCQGEGYTIWTAKCRTQAEGSCLIFFDPAEDQNGQWVSDACRGGCGGTHQFKVGVGEGIPQPNCYLLVNVRDGSGSGSSTISQYSDWFTSATGHNGVGWTIKPDMVQTLIDNKQLVRGYYNDHVLKAHGFIQPWLVTADPSNMKQMS